MELIQCIEDRDVKIAPTTTIIILCRKQKKHRFYQPRY